MATSIGGDALLAEQKRYFWLKLKEDFFRDKTIKKLRKVAGGDTYTIIYLKLQLLALKEAGKLIFENIEDTFYEEMALEIDEDIENVKITIMFLMQYCLLEEINENEYILPQTMECIGVETQGAERVRRHREKKKALQCNIPVTIGNTEKEKEIEIEIEKEIELQLHKDKSSGGGFNIFIYMQQHGFVSISPMLMEKITADIKLYSLEEVKTAIEIADNAGKHSYNYVRGILEKRRAGINEKMDSKKQFEQACKEFLEDDTL